MWRVPSIAAIWTAVSTVDTTKPHNEARVASSISDEEFYRRRATRLGHFTVLKLVAGNAGYFSWS